VLRDAGVLVTDLRSSRWCRATQTAELAFPDVPLKPEASLDSFFNEPGREQEQSKQARALISSWRRRRGTLALVTHQVNITALTSLFAAEGEIVVVRPRAAAMEVVGRVRI
jgi:phosphohistidine phosphatase SixA